MLAGLLAMLPCATHGQGYAALWKQADDAEAKDLPRTQIGVLREIAAKAEANGDYGQMLKAAMKATSVAAILSPDSLAPAIARIEQRMNATSDPVLRAVYAATLCRVYRDNPTVASDAKSRADTMRLRAMAAPEALAKAKAKDFAPFVVDGYDGKVFGNDMLSVIGYEVGDYATLQRYYSRTGNRPAACMAALEMIRQHRENNAERIDKSDYIVWLDSLINVYSDLDVACEAAIERYNYMEECTDATVEERISYIHYALDKWGGWHGAGRLRNAERNLTAPCFAVSMERCVVEPGVEQKVTLSRLRNINSLTVRIYRADTDGQTRHDPATETGFKEMQPLLTLLREKGQTRRYMSHPDYQFFEDSLTIGALDPGVYVLEFRTSPSTETVRRMYYVTNLRLLSLPLPKGGMRYVALNATTGQPVAGAKVSLRPASATGKDAAAPITLTCDANGEAMRTSEKQESMFATVSTDDDRYCPGSYAYGRFTYNTNANTREQTRVYTDRKVYRPGQTVRVAAVVYAPMNGTDCRAVAGKTVRAMLRDANYKVVAERELLTDEFGTCSTDFTLPTGMLGGRFTVTVNGSSASCRVEEYKRPTFTVEFPKVNQRYENGDTLVVRAKAMSFAGVPVQGAKFSYTVERRQALWYRFADNEPTARLWQGEGTTGADGSLTIEMPLELPETAKSGPGFFNIVATVDVTDASGETHTGELSVPLGSRPTSFSCDLPQQALADSLKTVTFTLRNASGESISVEVRMCLDGSGEWLTGRTNEPIAIGKRLSSGRHSLLAICESDTLRKEFLAFGLDDTVPCTQTDEWFYLSSNTFAADGSPLTMQIGSSDSCVHILYNVMAGDSVIASGTADITNAIYNAKLSYKPEYGDGLRICYAWVKRGKCHSRSFCIEKPRRNTSLSLKWTTFRDRLTPGQQEVWSIEAVTPDGKPANAQLMATLYDKALDEITPHTWRFSQTASFRIPSTQWNTPNVGGIYGSGMQAWTSQAYSQFEVSRFDNSVLPAAYNSVDYIAYGRPRRSLLRTKGGYVAATRSSTDDTESAFLAIVDAAAAPQAKASNTAGSSAEAEAGSGDEADGSHTTMQLRENLNETAFFMPSLQTDSTGTFTISFTLPESLTTWRFIGLAHTADMASGMIEGEAVARKDVMVMPNVPRFVREGDKARVTARIINMSDKAVSGTAQLELIDPDTESSVLSSIVKFSAKADSTIGVAFDFEPPADISLLICRVTASGATFSDGEQHYLPVLPNRERVTVAAPFVQKAPGTHSVYLPSLFPNGSTQRKLTVEYTNNPAWLMVQALPAAASTNSDNAIDQCAAYYANAIGQAIVGQWPAIKTTVERWQMERGDERSMQNNLARNAELRDIVLAETPWVADADREEEQKQRLADFFDASLTQSRLNDAASKLRSLQLPDGSWSWWPGMEGSLNVTVEVAEMMVRLNAMTGQQEPLRTMLDKAFGFMESRITEQVNAMKKAEQGGQEQTFPGSTALRYLYLCAIDGRKQSPKAEAAADYLVNLLKKEVKDQTIYDKALSAIILHKRGERQKSIEYAKSLKEHSVATDEMGRYYDTPKAAYHWRDYTIPTEVAAMEALAMITPEDSTTLGEMRQWLLRQKQVQAWDTPINTANAIFAFINGNAATLKAQAATTLAIDGKEIEQPEATAGLGYVKVAVNNPDGDNLTATKSSTGMSWGAVYAQSTASTAEAERQSDGIRVERKIIAPEGGLRVGSRVTVRITIRAAHDFDFVVLSDRRAACMEPVSQLSGYRNGAYCSPKDNATNYYFDRLRKGTHVVETEYFIDRAGSYETGTCSVTCAYAPEYRATTASTTIVVAE